jgi:fumarate reductase subunit C
MVCSNTFRKMRMDTVEAEQPELEANVAHPRTRRPGGGMDPGLQAPLVERARRQLRYELISGLSGVALALFMWGHMVLVGSILTGARGFDWIAQTLERYYVAQPTVAVIFVLFLLHAAMASRKIPAQLEERRRMLALARDLRRPGLVDLPGAAHDARLEPHMESLLWIWQVRTGMLILVLGSFHVILLGLDVLTPLFGTRAGIEAVSTFARVQGGLWPLYAALLLCVEFHASVGLYRFTVKWGAGRRLSRQTLHRIEQALLVFFLGVGALALVVMAGWFDPPLALLLGTGE